MLGKLGECFSLTSLQGQLFQAAGAGLCGGEAQSGYVVFFGGACGHLKPGAFGSESQGLCTHKTRPSNIPK